MATIHPLKCNNCGANLNVNRSIKYFRCASCGSSLELREEGNIYYTHILEELKSEVSEIKDHTQGILIEQQILRLDRDWEVIRSNLSKTTEAQANFTAILVMIVVLVGIAVSYLATIYTDFAIFAIIFGIVLFLMASHKLSDFLNTPSDYERAKRKYLTARAELLAKLNEE